MSTYTIGEIALWLVLTAVLGFALGWLTRELVVRAAHGAPAPAPSTIPVAAPDEPDQPPEVEVEPEPGPQPVVPGPHPGSALPRADGSAPSPQHVVKVSRTSTIYHAPSSPAWARTTAAFWFTSAEDAEAAGFRPPKNG